MNFICIYEVLVAAGFSLRFFKKRRLKPAATIDHHNQINFSKIPIKQDSKC